MSSPTRVTCSCKTVTTTTATTPPPPPPCCQQPSLVDTAWLDHTLGWSLRNSLSLHTGQQSHPVPSTVLRNPGLGSYSSDAEMLPVSSRAQHHTPHVFPTCLLSYALISAFQALLPDGLSELQSQARCSSPTRYTEDTLTKQNREAS